MKPRVSFCAPCNRPDLFEMHLGSLEKNSTPFECLYVGTSPFPDDLRGRWPFLKFYYGDVTCAEASAWALTQGTGDLLCSQCDDMEWEPGALDQLVAAYDAAGDYKLMPSPRYWIDGKDWNSHSRLVVEDEGVPQLPMLGLISRRFYDELGGCDRAFLQVLHLYDVFQRALMAGGSTVFPGCVYHERRELTRHVRSLWTAYRERDDEVLRRLWFTPPDFETYTWPHPRNREMWPYTATDLADIEARLTESPT